MAQGRTSPAGPIDDAANALAGVAELTRRAARQPIDSLLCPWRHQGFGCRYLTMTGRTLVAHTSNDKALQTLVSALEHHVGVDDPVPQNVDEVRKAVAEAFDAIEPTVLFGRSLRFARLDGARLFGATLESADLYGADLNFALLWRANLNSANLDRAELEYADLQNADLSLAEMERADLYYAHLEQAALRSADLDRANLNASHLEGGDLSNASLRDASLQGAHLEGANLFAVYLNGAQLQRTEFMGALLDRVHLEGSDLDGTDFRGADLKGVTFATARPFGFDEPVVVLGGNGFGDVDLLPLVPIWFQATPPGAPPPLRVDGWILAQDGPEAASLGAWRTSDGEVLRRARAQMLADDIAPRSPPVAEALADRARAEATAGFPHLACRLLADMAGRRLVLAADSAQLLHIALEGETCPAPPRSADR